MSGRSFTCACVVALAAVFTACDDDDPDRADATGGRSATGGAPSDAGAENGGESSAEAGATGARLVPCLDRPGELQRPPNGSLPCDLLPPDFGRR